jgi:hypothetical protein
MATEISVGDGSGAVAEEVTNSRKIGPFALKLDGIGVPETVGVNPLLDSGLLRKPREEVPDVGLLDSAARKSAEDRGATVDATLAADIQPALKKGCGACIDADDPSLPALSSLYDECPAFQVDVLWFKSENFSDSQARPPGESNHRSIADSCRGAIRARPQERLDFAATEEIRVECSEEAQFAVLVTLRDEDVTYINSVLPSCANP